MDLEYLPIFQIYVIIFSGSFCIGGLIMLRQIAVCDDEKAMLRQLSLYLEQIQKESGDQYEIYYYSSAEELLAHMPRQVQVILLDISMGDLSGMDCARLLRKEGVEAEIFFVTSMTEYALGGYEIHAFAFLEKPVTYSELKRNLSECFSRIDKKRRSVLPIISQNGTELLPVEDILYAEVYQHETSFSLRSGRKITSILQLSEVESRLSKQGFFRCHRSYLVNMQAVSRINPSGLTLTDGSVIPVSKYRYKEFLSAYSLFMGVRLG